MSENQNTDWGQCLWMRNMHEEAQSQAEVTRLIYLGEPGEMYSWSCGI